MEKVKRILHRIIFFLCKLFRVRGYGISLIVPLHIDGLGAQRAANWNWLRKYWRTHLWGAEIIVGRDEGANLLPFSKSIAVNDAVSRALGDIYVIVDADVMIPHKAVLRCAKEIRNAEKKDRALWFVPYRKVYRLTKETSATILASSPWRPSKTKYEFCDEDVTNKGQFDGTPISSIGHWYGAMAQIVSKKAFDTVGGWCEAFRGWGAEDHAAMVATDTLYGPHKTLPSEVIHLWHPVITESPTDDPSGRKRMWTNQTTANANSVLSGRFYRAQRNVEQMRQLVDEFKKK
jgi:hypothetical protein